MCNITDNIMNIERLISCNAFNKLNEHNYLMKGCQQFTGFERSAFLSRFIDDMNQIIFPHCIVCKKDLIYICKYVFAFHVQIIFSFCYSEDLLEYLEQNREKLNFLTRTERSTMSNIIR